MHPASKEMCLQRDVACPDPPGRGMYELVKDLYPMCRSITGDGVRRTLQVLGREMQLEMYEVPSGTPVFDWTVPKEWNIRSAWIKNARGETVVDFANHNLHVLQYSVPVRRRMPLAELRPHLFSLPEHPEWIPYRTSYYSERWGFCLPHRALERLEEGEYEVAIDSSLEDGHLTYGECYLPGESESEVLISCHVCHPSLCNDNLSGIAVAVWLAKALSAQPRRYSYRFLFIPGTIGSITWLARNEPSTSRIMHGLVVSGVGGPGHLHYKKSRRGDSEIDRTVAHVLKHRGKPYTINEFWPYGYDERQYCSPGFNLPVGSLTRAPHGSYPEYHTSADNLDFISPNQLEDSLDAYRSVVRVLEHDRLYESLNPRCEPQLGKRGLYRRVGGDLRQPELELAMLWVLNLADGAHSLLDIAERSHLPFDLLSTAAGHLVTHGLLADRGWPGGAGGGARCGAAPDVSRP